MSGPHAADVLVKYPRAVENRTESRESFFQLLLKSDYILPVTLGAGLGSASLAIDVAYAGRMKSNPSFPTT